MQLRRQEACVHRQRAGCCRRGALSRRSAGRRGRAICSTILQIAGCAIRPSSQAVQRACRRPAGRSEHRHSYEGGAAPPWWVSDDCAMRGFEREGPRAAQIPPFGFVASVHTPRTRPARVAPAPLIRAGGGVCGVCVCVTVRTRACCCDTPRVCVDARPASCARVHHRHVVAPRLPDHVCHWHCILHVLARRQHQPWSFWSRSNRRQPRAACRAFRV